MNDRVKISLHQKIKIMEMAKQDSMRMYEQLTTDDERDFYLHIMHTLLLDDPEMLGMGSIQNDDDDEGDED